MATSNFEPLIHHSAQMASSTCPAPPCTIRGTHQFEIVGYSLIKGFAAGEYVFSGSFTVGSYRWSVRFYPGGFSAPHRSYVAAFLKLTSKNTKAWSRYDLRLVDRGTGLSRSVHCATEPVVFVSSFPPPPAGKCNKSTRGAREFMLRGELEASAAYLCDDRLTIECVVDVVADEARVPEVVALCRLRLPPSELAKHLGELLMNEQDSADVTLDIQGEMFGAHRVVLAARSPVFMAELHGQMKEKAMERIAIDDMQPVVFRALLHFVYTDTLLLPGDLDGDDYREMVRHLLEAADRYGVERMKQICESILCRSVDGATVETTLALADRHYCQALTDICLQFMSLELEE